MVYGLVQQKEGLEATHHILVLVFLYVSLEQIDDKKREHGGNG